MPLLNRMRGAKEIERIGAIRVISMVELTRIELATS